MANPPSLLSDQSQAAGDQGGIWGGITGLLGLFKPDYSAEYTGSLAKDPTTGQMDPAVQRAFAMRSLAGASQAFAQGGMPVPYKGGIPLLSTIGQAGAAATLGPDSLIDARLKAAQQQQAMAAAGLNQGQLGLLSTLGPAYQALIKKGIEAQSGGGGGTGPDGKPKTGPAAVLAQQGGGGSSMENTWEFKNNNFTGLRIPGVEKGPNAGGFQSFATPEDSVKATGAQIDRYASGATTGKPLTTIRDIVSTWAPPGQNDTGAMIDRTSKILATDPDKPLDLSNPLVKAQLTEALSRNEFGGVLHPKMAAAIGSVYGADYKPYGPVGTAKEAPANPETEAQFNQPTSKMAGIPGYGAPGAAAGGPTPTGLLGQQTLESQLAQINQRGGGLMNPSGGAPPPLAAPPNAALIGPPGQTIPDPRAAPPTAAAPGPTSLLGPQDGGAPGPGLSPAAAEIAKGMAAAQGGGQPAGPQFAGPGAAEPAAPAMVSGLPQPSGALPSAPSPGGGLLANPPAAPPPPPAAPAPVSPQATPAPPAAAPQGPPVAPPVNLPPIPSEMPAMPAMPTPPQATPQQMIAQGIAGISSLTGHPAPQFIQDLAGMPTQMALEQYKAWVGGQANMMTEQYKKQIEIAGAGTISWLQSQGQLPADLTKMTTEQNLKLRNELLNNNGIVIKPDGTFAVDPTWLEAKGRAAQAEADAKARAEQQTAAAAPQKLGPTDLLVLPPNSPSAQTYHDAQMRNQKLPDGVTILPNGAVQIQSLAPTGDQIKANTEDLLKMKDAAQTARQGIYETQQLRQQLHSIGMSGPATGVYSELGAWAQSLGILSEDQVKRYIGLSPANEQVAEKMSQDLLGEVLKTTFPQRITNADIAAWKNTVPRGTQLQGAYDTLIDKILMPKFEQSVGRYGAVAGLGADDPQLRTYTRTLETYDKAHPLGSFVHTYGYGPGGHRLRLEGNQWVDDAANPVQP